MREGFQKVPIGWAFYVLYKIYAEDRPTQSRGNFRIFSYYAALLGAYGAVYLLLLASPRPLV